jgi:amino-acid N-acetyltransferase
MTARRPASKPRIAAIEFDEDVGALLTRCGLPAADADASGIRLYGCRRAGALAGIVGLEPYGSVGLLRSLAVAEGARTHGLGHALVAHVEKVAARSGVRELYLLTTTAADFFARLGYANASRRAAPAAIAATTQFTGLCPSSATFMSKTLRPSAA